jgi:tetratricopeptide (TPR) repeat protein
MRNFGQEHPTVAIRQSNLATVLQDLGDYPRAAQLFQSSLDSAMRNFGQDHPTVAVRQLNLATVYYEVDRLEEAKILLEQALQTVEKKLGVGHPHYAGIIKWLDAVNKKLGERPGKG